MEADGYSKRAGRYVEERKLVLASDAIAILTCWSSAIEKEKKTQSSGLADRLRASTSGFAVEGSEVDADVEGNDAIAIFDIKTEVGVCVREVVGRVGHWGR
jgi:hypothetical protein